MKKKLIVFPVIMLFAMTMLTVPVYATPGWTWKWTWECDVVLDEVDIGDPTSELDHGKWGWGPIEPDTHGGGWGGFGPGTPYTGNCRVTWYDTDGSEGRDAGVVFTRPRFSVMKEI